ncbi:hypothetical protein [Porphyromonas cangingivalis]|uniref:hypothetical protein n=1 Tax=Porphyromonas cangingivalis TaxID=36874 RepID=UPI0011DD298B|nr:hypothetical protein [Porphyromonas cangingivalis]
MICSQVHIADELKLSNDIYYRIVHLLVKFSLPCVAYVELLATVRTLAGLSSFIAFLPRPHIPTFETRNLFLPPVSNMIYQATICPLFLGIRHFR